jgi:hypothetical protein
VIKGMKYKPQTLRGWLIAKPLGRRWDGIQELPYMAPMMVFTHRVEGYTIYVHLDATRDQVMKRMLSKVVEDQAVRA